MNIAALKTEMTSSRHTKMARRNQAYSIKLLFQSNERHIKGGENLGIQVYLI